MEREYIVVNVWSAQHKKEIEHIILTREIKFVAWAPGDKAIISLGPGLFIATEESYKHILQLLNLHSKFTEESSTESPDKNNVILMQRPEP